MATVQGLRYERPSVKKKSFALIGELPLLKTDMLETIISYASHREQSELGFRNKNHLPTLKYLAP